MKIRAEWKRWMKSIKEDKEEGNKEENKKQFKKYIIKVIDDDNKEKSVQVINSNDMESGRK